MKSTGDSRFQTRKDGLGYPASRPSTVYPGNGLYVIPPALQLSWLAAAVSRVDGNLPFAVDFRDLYATVLERWWGADSTRALKGRFAPLDVVRA